jgi:hypothetical protein
MLQQARFANELKDHEKNGTTHTSRKLMYIDRFRGIPFYYNLERVVYSKNTATSAREIAALTDFFCMFLQILS